MSDDVQDVAHAHVLMLKLPLPSESPKRLVLSTNTFTWKEAIEVISEKGPKLKECLPFITGKEFPVGPYYWPYSTLDISKTKSLLGMKNYVKWQDSVLPVDTMDDLLRIEKGFSGQPHKMRDQREDRVEKPHKWKKLGLRHGLVDAARQSRV